VEAEILVLRQQIIVLRRGRPARVPLLALDRMVPDGELVKLGIDIGQTSVAKYMTRRRWPPSRDWKTFVRNNADGIARWVFLSFRR
jgi:hypothetical protein